MNKLKHFLLKYTLNIIYSSLIAPHFNNNILLWGFNTHRLIKLQKRAIRISTDSKLFPYGTVTEILKYITNKLQYYIHYPIPEVFFHN